MTTPITPDEDPMNVAKTVLPEAEILKCGICNKSAVGTCCCGVSYCSADCQEKHLDQAHEDDEEEPLYECANCEVRFPVEQLEKIKDFWERHEPGDMVAAGECPECHALCFPVKPAVIDLAREVLRSHVLSLAELLEEAHERDRKTYAQGRSHGGDGAAGCSYCAAIKGAKQALKKY